MNKFRLVILFVFILNLNSFSQQADFSSSKNQQINPPIYLGEPPQNAGTLIKYPDGSIKYYFRKGSWDDDGFSSMVYSITTFNEGDNWTDPEEVVDTGEHTRAQNFLTVSPVTGEMILFYFDKQMNIWRVRSQNNQTDWSDNRQLNDFRHSGICYGHCIWIDLSNGTKRVLCGYHGSNGTGAGTYYSDDDGVTWKSSNRVYVPDLIPNIWHTGAVEPTFVELNDGQIWMLLRNSNDRLYECFSSDKGETWSEPKPSRFYCGPNSWATLKQLSSGEILLVWNNAMCMDPMATQDKWSFSNRDVIHATISDDDGKTWHGFRELFRDPMRDSSDFCNAKGDKGLNESMIVETDQGNILISCGQALGHRAFLHLDRKWLYQTENYGEFSERLKYLSRQKLIVRPPIYNRLYHHNYNRKKGARLVPHPTKLNKKILHIRKPKDPNVYSQRDGAVWNFPAGSNGEFETKILLKDGFKGGIIALNDRWFQPTDSQGERTAMFRLEIPTNGKIKKSTQLENEKWYTIRLVWKGVLNASEDSCEVYINGKLQTTKLPLLNASINGISYVRFRSTAINPDTNGFYVEYVKSKIK